MKWIFAMGLGLALMGCTELAPGVLVPSRILLQDVVRPELKQVKVCSETPEKQGISCILLTKDELLVLLKEI